MYIYNVTYIYVHTYTLAGPGLSPKTYVSTYMCVYVHVYMYMYVYIICLFCKELPAKSSHFGFVT